MTNFRPWLVNGREFNFNKNCETANFKNLSKDDKQKIAKHQDIYDFGVALYELMLAKTSKGESVDQQVILSHSED